MPKARPRLPLRLSRRTRPFQESVIREMTRLHAEAFVDFLARKVGVIAVPGSSFYARNGGKTNARFNSAKRDATLRDAALRLAGADLRAGRR